MNKHWSVDEEKLKADKEKYTIWQLEQRINFNIGEGKIDKNQIIKYWNKIDIDPYKRKALSLVIQP
jgi:hypothetical protein